MAVESAITDRPFLFFCIDWLSGGMRDCLCTELNESSLKHKIMRFFAVFSLTRAEKTVER